MAQLQKIKKGFYTDGENLYSNVEGMVCVWCKAERDLKLFLDHGNEPARCHDEKIVKPVKPGMRFCDGEIRVIDKESIEILRIEAVNRKVDSRGYTVSFDGYTERKVIVNPNGRVISTV